MGAMEEITIQQLVSFLFTPHQCQVAHFLQMFTGLGTVIVVGRTAPKGFLVQC